MKKIKYILLILIFSSCQTAMTDKELNEKYLDAFKASNWKDAIKYLDEKINRNPKDAYAYYARAMAKSNRKSKMQINEILADLDNSIKLDSKNEQAIFFRFQANLIALKFKKAMEDINLLIEKKGELPFLLSWKGNCAFASREFKIAELAYEKRLALGGQYDEMRDNYYYFIFSKYFGGNKEGAIWDCAFLKDRGFEENMELLNAIENDKLKWEELASFKIPEMTIEQLDEQLKEK